MYAKVFRQGPARNLMVAPGAPFAIHDVSDAYLEATSTDREIVGRAHEGRIDVESTPQGTHFMVFIPVG